MGSLERMKPRWISGRVRSHHAVRPGFRLKLVQQFEHGLLAFLWRTGEIHLCPPSEIVSQGRIKERIQLWIGQFLRRLEGVLS
jgi:hypothetical protein